MDDIDKPTNWAANATASKNALPSVIQTRAGSYPASEITHVVVHKKSQLVTFHFAGEKGEFASSVLLAPQTFSQLGWMDSTIKDTASFADTFINPSQIKNIKPAKDGAAATVTFKGFNEEWAPMYDKGELKIENPGMGTLLKMDYKEAVSRWEKALSPQPALGI